MLTSLLIICVTVVVLAGLVVFNYLYREHNGRRVLDDHGVKGLNALTAYSKSWKDPLASLAGLVTSLARRPCSGSVTERVADPDPVDLAA
ncbi:hypothetical protein ACFWFQ_38155 [Nocardia salmonicida]|uniref:hypothetical protein n=1 Tax=Nocardia salmonicida TaxID=53431 RepID=UPI0036534A05